MSRFSDLDRKFIVSDFYGCCFFSLHCANVNFLPDRAEVTAVGLSGECSNVVERRRIELPTFALRTRRSPI